MTLPLALILEDDPNLGRIFQKTLQESGFETALDPDGNQYQRIMSNVEPALVILDMHLPYASGQQILAGLRGDPQTTRIPILIVTADLYLAKGLQAVNEQVIIKPVSPFRLIGVVKKMLHATEKDSHDK